MNINTQLRLLWALEAFLLIIGISMGWDIKIPAISYLAINIIIVLNDYIDEKRKK